MKKETLLITETDNFDPNALNKLGFSPEEVININPNIIYVNLSAYSRAGPWSDKRGFDSLVQSVSGIASENGTYDQPRHLPAQVLDYLRVIYLHMLLC